MRQLAEPGGGGPDPRRLHHPDRDGPLVRVRRRAPADDILARYPRIVHPHRRPDSEVGAIALELMLDERILGVVTELIGRPWRRSRCSTSSRRRPAARPCTRTTSICARIRRPASPLGSPSTTATPTTADGRRSRLARLEVLCPEDADPETSFTTITVHVPEGVEVVQTEMKAGDVLFFHGSVVHGLTTEQHHRPVPPVADLPLHPRGQRRGVDVLPAAVSARTAPRSRSTPPPRAGRVARAGRPGGH